MAACVTVNPDQNLPLRLVEGTDDDLVLSFNTDGFKGYVAKMMRDERFLVTADLVGQPECARGVCPESLLVYLYFNSADVRAWGLT